MENRKTKNVCDDKKIKLWTIQHEDAYKNFDKTGVLRANNNYLFCEDDVRHAYDWISEQMVKRIGKPPSDDIKYPIWAWYQCEGKRKKMDQRRSGYATRGTPLVQIEFEVPAKDVLLSDFDEWFLVMGYYYIAENNKDNDEFYDRHEEACKLEFVTQCEKDDPRYQMLKEIKESWTKVFDLENSSKRGFCNDNEQTIQATLWQVTMEQVCKVEHFIAK